MKTKKFCTLLVTIGVIFAAKSQADIVGNTGTLTLNYGSPQYENGGAFLATSTTLGTFETFCIEYNEEFTPSSSTLLTYQINTGAVAGGSGGQDAHSSQTLSSGASMDNISKGTAYLYSLFMTPGGFTGGLAVSSSLAAGNLQDAIWYLEGEQSSPIFNGADGTSYINLAELAIYGSSGTAALDAIKADSSAGEYGVYALNLYNPDGTKAQDQLYYSVTTQVHSSIPETSTVLAGLAMLLPLGASTVRILRKNRVA